MNLPILIAEGPLVYPCLAFGIPDRCNSGRASIIKSNVAVKWIYTTGPGTFRKQRDLSGVK